MSKTKREMHAAGKCGKASWIFSENCQKITTENAQIWIFPKHFKCKCISCDVH